MFASSKTLHSSFFGPVASSAEPGAGGAFGSADAVVPPSSFAAGASLAVFGFESSSTSAAVFEEGPPHAVSVKARRPTSPGALREEKGRVSSRGD